MFQQSAQKSLLLLPNPSCALARAFIQIVLAVIIAAVTATELDMANGDCYLNLVPGRVCE